MKDHLYKTLSPECNYGVKYYTFLYNELPNSRVYFFDGLVLRQLTEDQEFYDEHLPSLKCKRSIT